jgi:hypothetical protein
MPLDRDDPVLQLVLRASDVLETLNQQPLQVTGLPHARYTLTIDGTRVGEFTREELNEGVNLAVLPTPMARQSRRVHALTVRRSELQLARWRQIQVPIHSQPTSHLSGVTQAMEVWEEELVKQQRAAAQPGARRYGLLPLSGTGEHHLIPTADNIP